MNISELQGIDEAVNMMDDIEWYGMDFSASVPTDDGLSTAEVNNIDVGIDDNAR